MSAIVENDKQLLRFLNAGEKMERLVLLILIVLLHVPGENIKADIGQLL